MKFVPLIALSMFASPMLALAGTESQSIVSTSASAVGYPASRITVSRWDKLKYTTVTEHIQPGATEKRVLRLLGKPSRELAPGLVEYDNCAPDQAEAGHCTILLVSYEQGRVASLVFANRPMAEQIALSTLRRVPPEAPDSKTLPTAIAAPN